MQGLAPICVIRVVPQIDLLSERIQLRCWTIGVWDDSFAWGPAWHQENTTSSQHDIRTSVLRNALSVVSVRKSHTCIIFQKEFHQLAPPTQHAVPCFTVAIRGRSRPCCTDCLPQWLVSYASLQSQFYGKIADIF